MTESPNPTQAAKAAEENKMHPKLFSAVKSELEREMGLTGQDILLEVNLSFDKNYESIDEAVRAILDGTELDTTAISILQYCKKNLRNVTEILI